MKKSKNELNKERFSGDVKPRRLKSNKASRHHRKQRLHELDIDAIKNGEWDSFDDDEY